MEVLEIPLDSISVDPNQPRKTMSEESLRGLADSIKQHGLLNPITVTRLPEEDRFRLISGESRWRSAAMIKLETVPCIIKHLAKDEILTEQLIENLQREDLQPLEKAKAISYVKHSLSLTNREISGRLGLSERTISYLLDLLSLPDNIGEAVVSSPNRPADGQITEKHARFLKQLSGTPELQSAVADRIKDQKLSSEDTGNLVKALKKQPGRSEEIFNSAAGHLSKFFGDDNDPAGNYLESMKATDPPMRISANTQHVLDFLPGLSSINVSNMTTPELRQFHDSLTSLKIAVDSLIHSCKKQLGEKI